MFCLNEPKLSNYTQTYKKTFSNRTVYGSNLAYTTILVF